MEPIPQQGIEDPARVERSRPGPAAASVVLFMLATLLLGIVFFLLTGGGRAG